MQALSVLTFLLCVFKVVANDALNGHNQKSNKRIMVWMCLEFCDDTQEDISQQLQQIEHNKKSIRAVSFEKYTLGPNSTLVDNELTEVASAINSMGLESWPLLSSFPHPPQFIDWMREVFRTPDPFIQSCIDEAERYKYIGYNLDWEPTGDGVTNKDGENYATFITTFADALHARGLGLSVDLATWSPIWNLTAIAASTADKAISMGTYTGTDTSFSSQLSLLVDAFGTARAGVGLETVNASTGDRLSIQEVEWRFEEIAKAGVQEVALWRMPVPPLWWTCIEKFLELE
jgi:hypothetical protein